MSSPHQGGSRWLRQAATSLAQLVLLAVAAVAPAIAQPATVVVDNTSSAIDGNTSGIPQLIGSPGFDGISLMEAIAAANNTSGPKRITFSPALRGMTIPFGTNDLAEIGFFSLRSGDLTIDGDIDADGTPDIILDATGRDLATIRIRSSRIVINGLLFREFGGQAINFACEDTACLELTISDVRITNNVIESHRGGGIELGVFGLLEPSNAPLLSGHAWVNIIIDHNTIRGPVNPFSNAVGIRPCSDGAFNNRANGIFITNNRLTSAVAIDIAAADESILPNFSDHCLIDNLVIDANVIEDSSTGIKVYSSNLGNQHNTAQHIRITSNHLRRNRQGMLLGTANLPIPERSTSFNVMSDLLVSGNEIADSDRAMIVSAGNWPQGKDAPTGVDDNTLSDVVISGNDIHGFRNSGLQVWAGLANVCSGSRNRIDRMMIAGNTFEAAAGAPATALELMGGDSRNGRIAADNTVTGVTVTGNTFRGNQLALSLIGGRGSAAHDNLLSLAMSSNVFDGNVHDFSAVIDDLGASNNRIEFTSRRRAVRH